jgi:hypothetical protein
MTARVITRRAPIGRLAFPGEHARSEDEGRELKRAEERFLTPIASGIWNDGARHYAQGANREIGVSGGNTRGARMRGEIGREIPPPDCIGDSE